MSKKRRILVELLAPAFLATLWLVVTSSHEAQTLSVIIFGSCALLVFSYLFAIVPSAMYAIAMEIWFRSGLGVRLGLLCTSALSCLLGAAGGFLSGAIGRVLGFLTPSDNFHFARAGAVIGLLIGFYVSRKSKSVA
jgi:hypothetical protein